MTGNLPSLSDQLGDFMPEQRKRELDAVPIAITDTADGRSILFPFHFPAGAVELRDGKLANVIRSLQAH